MADEVEKPIVMACRADGVDDGLQFSRGSVTREEGRNVNCGDRGRRRECVGAPHFVVLVKGLGSRIRVA